MQMSPEMQLSAISIHVLREEDDRTGRKRSDSDVEFLSTSSARRTTLSRPFHSTRRFYFYPRPPRGGRPMMVGRPARESKISIHVLREEDDPCAVLS